jgi:NADPH:quinone reductase-like Zn-dependent oxidoreductase/NAD(P)-dependent dehydrogenase (short-subunit alcohol dehydrogenase family)
LGEVEIRVVAAGLNFRDVLNAMAMRADSDPLGGECSGVVTAVGPGVDGVLAGDRVVAIASGCMATRVIARLEHTARLPEGIGCADAATLPIAFMTARHALLDIARVGPGQTVLIHAGAGGVGLAAVQVAQRAGATVFATAGSGRKRAFLTKMGVALVADSRRAGFGAEVLARTGGRGVDVVLNSLVGEAIAESVACLSASGCFVEIGKRDLWSAGRFAEARPGSRYVILDLSAMRLDDPQRWTHLFQDVVRAAGAGEIRPLPFAGFPLERASSAFRFMAQARHIGKVLLTDADAVTEPIGAPRADSSYLVTGGLDGLGLATARRLAERGAGRIVLAGRRAPGESALAAIDAMRAAGSRIVIERADVSDPADLRRLVAVANEATMPLRGVIHSAGVLADGALARMTWERFAQPLGPKVDGSWGLHLLTRDLPLGFFVLYSSAASILGSPGQSNHAAANAFMDALAVHRRARGLPALSIGWGAWRDIGSAARHAVDTDVARRGIDAIDPDAGLDWLECLGRGAPPHVGVIPARWNDFVAAGARPAVRAFLGDLLRASPTPSADVARDQAPPTGGAGDLLASLAGVTAARRSDLLKVYVADNVARVLAAPDASAIDPRQPLNELGLDSLLAVELRNRLGAAAGLSRSLPSTLVFDYPTIDALSSYLDGVLPGGGSTAAPGGEREAEKVSEPIDSVEELTDEQVEALFARRMQGS